MLTDEVDYVVGVDTHRDEHVLAVVAAPAGAVVARRAVRASARGYHEALDFAEQHANGARVWAVEGAGHYGAGLARFLSCHGEPVEAIDRADLGKQLGGSERAATRQLEQRRRRLRGPPLELAVELEDRAGQLAAMHDQFARDPHLHLRWPAGEPTADTIKMHRSVERFRGDEECWVELMQVPAQPLLRAAALVDEIIAMVDQQFQLSKRLLVRARAAQPRLPQGGPGDSESIDRIRPAALPARPTLRGHQLWRHPHQLLADRDQLSLERPS